MPISLQSFRTVCGQFVSVFIAFMTRRARFKFAMRVRVVKVKSCSVAFALTFMIATLLHRSGDVELNPGPGDRPTSNDGTDQSERENQDIHPENKKQNQEDAILSAIGSLADQMREEMRNMGDKMTTELQSLKGDIGTVLTKCSELEEKCDSLEQKYSNLEDRVRENEAYQDEGSEERTAKIDNLTAEIESLKTEMDRLEGFSRRDNVRFFGLGPETVAESFPTCARKVVAALNDVQNPVKQWTEDDISRAHRTGQPRTNGPRPMIVQFSRGKDKRALLSNQSCRTELRSKGIRIASDLTNRQAALVAEAKKNGKFGYFKNGQLVVEDRQPPDARPPRRHDQHHTTPSVNQGNDNTDSHDDYPELTRPDHRRLRDLSPFSDASEQDSDAVTRRDSSGGAIQRRHHLGNRYSPTTNKQTVNKARGDRTDPKADRAVPSNNSANDSRGRGRGRGTPPNPRAVKPGVVTRNRAASREDRQGRIDDMLRPRPDRPSYASCTWK